MSSFDKDINQIEKMMHKYKFKEPIPEDVRAHVIAARKRLLKRILKTLGILTLGYSVFLTIYFFLKKLGISKLIASLIIASSVTTGTIVTIKYINSKNKQKPLGIHITPHDIRLTESDRVKNIQIITRLANSEKKDITALVKIKIEPEKLARIEKNKNNSFDLLFLQKGEGVLHVEWRGLKNSIALSYQPQTRHLNALEKLHQQYKHTEKILLEDGGVYKGVLIDTGDGNVSFITPEGVLKIKRKDIIKIEYLAPDKLK